MNKQNPNPKAPKADRSAVWHWHDSEPPYEKWLIALYYDASPLLEIFQAAIQQVRVIFQNEARMLYSRLCRGKWEPKHLYYACEVLTAEYRSQMQTVRQLIETVEFDFRRRPNDEPGESAASNRLLNHLYDEPKRKEQFHDIQLFWAEVLKSQGTRTYDSSPEEAE